MAAAAEGIDGVYSVRLVIADFYMEKPQFGLDPCYSELRGKEIKRVPVIRVFGGNSRGQKTCMHVHGVFPYFYIPFDRRDFESLERGILQIAMHLNKAINISLGQASSNAQHVFKIQLVKGIPFYGYHRAEHQFLKIYMFNPRFVRRAANLLQSGAILSKNFSPHESHVPYILQFMIDYNLYGMSNLHVPLEVLKFRRSHEDEVIPYANVKPAQLLDTVSVRKVACSALEVDVSSNFILNRFQLVAKSKGSHTNPGIEAIWNDESLRRQKLVEKHTAAGDEEMVQAVPVLKLPPTQERPQIEIAESDVFYRTALESKLMTLEQSTLSDQTLSDQTALANATMQTTLPGSKEQRRTFNLQKLLANAVYPEECSQDQQQLLVNASFIQNHVTCSNSNNVSLPVPNDVSEFMDETMVDEELILSLTQPHGTVPHDATLREEDLELLDALQLLEEQNESESHVDLDSSLAPLSQNHKMYELSPELLDKETAAAAAAGSHAIPDEDCDSDEDAEQGTRHDFSTALDDINELLLKLTQSQPEPVESKNQDPSTQLPQIDGADDGLQRTPKKKTSSKLNSSPPKTPTTPRGQASLLKSPRTPKTSAAKKYAPLPLTIGSSSAKKNNEETTGKVFNPRLSLQLDQGPQVRTPKSPGPELSLRRKLAMTELRRKSVEESNSFVRLKNDCTPLRSTRRSKRNLDKTHVTCSLTPRDRNPSFSDMFETADGERIPEESIRDQTEDSPGIKERREPKVSKKKPRSSEGNSLDGEKPRRSLRHQKNLINPDEYFTEIEKTQPGANTARRTQIHKKPRLGSNLEDVNVICTKSFEQNNGTHKINPVEKSLDNLNTRDAVKSPKQKHEIVTQQSKEVVEKNSDEINNLKSIECSVSKSETYGNSHEEEVQNELFQQKPDALHSEDPANPIETRQLASSDDEAIESDTESDTRVTKLRKTPNLRRLRRSFRSELLSQQVTPSSGRAQPDSHTTPEISPKSNENHTPELMRSFYEHSLIVNSPSVFSDILGSPSPMVSSMSNSFVISPLELPPSYDEVVRGCGKLDIPEYEFQKPFYSKPADVSKVTEVGFLVLHIPGNKLNDCEPFQSVLGNDRGLASWRRQQLIAIGGPAMLQRHRGEQRMREYFGSGQKVAIEPVQLAPTRQEAKVWLKAKELLRQREEPAMPADDIDSPIKIKRQKITMMLQAEAGDAASGDEDAGEDFNCSLSLTPLSQAKGKAKDTPISGKAKGVSRNRLQRGTKLNFKECQEEEIPASSQSSEQSVSSSAAQAALERSSFLRQLEGSSQELLQHDLSFGLSHATLDNTFGFKVNLENLQQAKADIDCNHLTIFTLEVFVSTRGELQPDPMHDEIRCLFYAIEHSLQDEGLPSKACGYIMVNSAQDLLSEGRIHGLDRDIEVQVVASESEAFEALLALCGRWDADIYAGYEIEMSSWGYVIDRAKHLCFNISPLLSRVPTQKVRDFVDEDREQFTDLDVEMKLCGRILLDVWRLMRSEIALTSYTFENVMYHILHKRCPWHSAQTLSEWFSSPCTRWIVMEYYLERVRGTLALLDQLDLLGRTSEMAKLIGIQFYEVLSRGSQFRVESMMLRIAKPKNLVPLSPSVQARAHMRAPEYLALIMEPHSRFYADPLIVLDFQSLYPSMIIAYNYCFSTCLGRVEHLGASSPFEFGASQLRVSRQMLQKLLEHDLVTVSPCGVVFVKREVREGILPRMLTEILDTRQMVKQSMKLHKDSSALQRILHSRQLGLKLMANVTYGYTAANFSGRMPAVEVGDSVVSKGRETLERAIKLVEANEEWKVRVVYGDTDSMFVLVPGRNRAEAFRIGEEIAQAVTEMNPQPVKLKLEKVYQPCLLQTKKRYVGYMYETADQAEPVYEAKGIETVRRDGCPAVAKMLEKVLRLLFETQDVSRIKQYVCRQFTKLLSGKANLQDLIFAKEFRGLNGYKPTACVPALELTRKWMQKDPRHVPRRGERVPFIIVNGPPGMQLIRLVRSPHDILANEGHKINAIYYITKAIIPPLNRCLLLIGANVHDWFASLPRKLLMTPAVGTANELAGARVAKSTISQYFSTTSCVIDCGRQTKAGICPECLRDATKCVAMLSDKTARLERGYQLTRQICQACCGRLGSLQCDSLDCPVRYVLEGRRRELQQIEHVQKLLEIHF
ncbi:DNA polymerase zeta catalytic subunit isoform X1 [Drosophila gunungcola]|uniref:DNA polymerase zeta catalytic subunit isoform X1 n=1 Tax=Drosophila gunungcola TaxID=103775 RepID=UPI0022E5D5C7|nr:DNA polymerase zeta catalytic subunit isoform X1 [Drosophila gunungcola]